MSLTASVINTIIAKADSAWQNGIESKDWVSRSEGLSALRMNQTAQLQELKDPNMDNKVRLVWLQPTAQVVEDYDGDCDFVGAKSSSVMKEYELTKKWHVAFRISEEELRTNAFTFEDIAAKHFLEADKLLSEYATKYALSKVEMLCAASKNPYPNTTWTIPALGVTEIPANQWKPDIIGEFIIAAKLANYSNPFLLSGLNMSLDNWKAQMNAGQSGNEGNVQMFRQIKTYFDLWNVDGTAAANRTYLLDKGTFAFVSKARWNTVETFANGANITRYSIASNVMEGVRFDVRYKTICENDSVDHVFEYILRCDVFTNPQSVKPGFTGAMAFHKS
jgi:hypothetical protein